MLVVRLFGVVMIKPYKTIKPISVLIKTFVKGSDNKHRLTDTAIIAGNQAKLVYVKFFIVNALFELFV